jgi:DNA polymerase III subunit delta'
MLWHNEILLPLFLILTNTNRKRIVFPSIATINFTIFAAMQFANVIGQQAVKKQLINMVNSNRLSHALLFLANEGSGGLPMAIAFANFLVCQKNPIQKTEHATAGLFGDALQDVTTTEFLEACGVCAGCIKAQQMQHPDVHYSYPVVPAKSGDKPKSTDYIAEWRQFVQEQPYANLYSWLQFIEAENKQGNITVEECNDIIRKMSLKSFESKYKILLVWMPEFLGKNGNKLLKLIEEPPPNTIFILVAENDAQILPTILSRTQLIKIPRLSHAEIAQALQAVNASQAQAEHVAAISNGNYYEAQQQLLQNNDDLNWEQYLKEWLNSILKTGPVAQIKFIEEIAKIGRERQKQFLQYFLHVIQIATELHGNPNVATTPNLLSFAQKFNNICKISQLQAIAQEVDAACYYIERNANAKILFNAITIKLYHIIANNSLILIH